MKNKYAIAALTGSLAVQWLVWEREYQVGRIKDYMPPDSWYFQNLGLIGIGLLLVTPILRHGSNWQQIAAILFSIWPAICLFFTGYYAFRELVSPG